MRRAYYFILINCEPSGRRLSLFDENSISTCTKLNMGNLKKMYNYITLIIDEIIEDFVRDVFAIKHLTSCQRGNKYSGTVNI